MGGLTCALYFSSRDVDIIIMCVHAFPNNQVKVLRLSLMHFFDPLNNWESRN